MVRTAHTLLDHHHALWQYVDDRLHFCGHRSSFFSASGHPDELAQGIPQFLPERDWMDHLLGNVDSSGQIVQILAQVDSLLRDSKVSIEDLQSALGRLVWLTGAWHQLRPLLIPLYRAMSNIPTAMVGVSPVLFKQMIDLVDDDLYLTKSLRSQHHTLAAGAKVTPVANTFVTDRNSLANAHVKTRRVWLGSRTRNLLTGSLMLTHLLPFTLGKRCSHHRPSASPCVNPSICLWWLQRMQWHSKLISILGLEH